MVRVRGGQSGQCEGGVWRVKARARRLCSWVGQGLLGGRLVSGGVAWAAQQRGCSQGSAFLRSPRLLLAILGSLEPRGQRLQGAVQPWTGEGGAGRVPCWGPARPPGRTSTAPWAEAAGGSLSGSPAALQDLEPQQLLLFVQSFGIPVSSMSKLLQHLDQAVAHDPQTLEQNIMDKSKSHGLPRGPVGTPVGPGVCGPGG